MDLLVRSLSKIEKPQFCDCGFFLRKRANFAIVPAPRVRTCRSKVAGSLDEDPLTDSGSFPIGRIFSGSFEEDFANIRIHCIRFMYTPRISSASGNKTMPKLVNQTLIGAARDRSPGEPNSSCGQCNIVP
ncbi:hypothetical protein [Blastopirellula marina]|uniref:hypothetical protein n=1 Tax=Blastopirellula marina TaxID=124 RepID=UPI001F281467|nr:hypothetical protein [Blastopirellula marina]